MFSISVDHINVSPSMLSFTFIAHPSDEQLANQQTTANAYFSTMVNSATWFFTDIPEFRRQNTDG